MKCVISCSSTSFPRLVFFFGALLWGSMIHKHTGRWMWQGSASVVSWNWEKYSCHSKLVSTLSLLPLSVLYWRVSQAWNPHDLISYNWAQVLEACDCLKLLFHLIYVLMPLVFLSSAWSSWHWSPCRRLWRSVPRRPQQGCRLPHARTPMACWKDIGCIRLTGSRARLGCSSFAKAQLRRTDFTHRNWTQVNTYRLLLSSFVCFQVRVKVNSRKFVGPVQFTELQALLACAIKS